MCLVLTNFALQCRYIRLVVADDGVGQLVPKEVTLPLSVMVGSVDNVLLKGWLERTMLAWGVQPRPGQNNVWVTTDRGSNIEKAVRESSTMRHIPCFSHIADRAVNAALELVGAGLLM